MAAPGKKRVRSIRSGADGVVRLRFEIRTFQIWILQAYTDPVRSKLKEASRY